jgi:hypothetical protein
MVSLVAKPVEFGIMVYEAVIKVDIYGVGLANTRAQL